MLKSILHFGNPAKLSLKNRQLVIDKLDGEIITRPLEDIGAMVIDHGEIRITTPLLTFAASSGVVIVWCDEKHLPVAYSHSISGHSLQNLRHRLQFEAGTPKFKQAWAQIIKAKLVNQAKVLELYGKENATLKRLAREIRSGDPENYEGQGARYYWSKLFGEDENFIRDPDGEFPNSFLNYGYSIVRAAMARSLAGAGFCLTLGIHHHNQYNSYCLADDCMEPYRPWVDLEVLKMISEEFEPELNPKAKARLLAVFHQDVKVNSSLSPMQVNMDDFSASLAGFFSGDSKGLILPEFPDV